MEKVSSISSFLLLIPVILFSQVQEFSTLTGPYLGQKPPGMTSEIFAPCIVSTNDLIEMGCTWTPNGREFYFGRSETSDIGSNWAIWGMREKDGIWSEPIYDGEYVRVWAGRRHTA